MLVEPEEKTEKPKKAKKIKKALLYGGYGKAVVEAKAEDAANRRTAKSTKSALHRLPSPEEIRKRVADIVLKEMESWSEELQALIGEQHPKAEIFTNGVPYVIGAYMKIAQDTVDRNTRHEVRTGELVTVKRMGPLVSKANSIKNPLIAKRNKQVKKLREDRDPTIRAAIKRIKREFQSKIDAAMKAPFPEEVIELEARAKQLGENFETFKEEKQAFRGEVSSEISDILNDSGEYEREQEKIRQKATQEKAEAKKKAEAEAAMAKGRKDIKKEQTEAQASA